MQKKINDLLEEPVKNDPAFAANYRLSYPICLSSIPQWMNELNIKYESQKKSCMIAIHERVDVVKDRRDCVINNNKKEINEPCWIQFKDKEFYKILSKYNISNE